MDGRILTELIDPLAVPSPTNSVAIPEPLYRSSMSGVGGIGHGITDCDPTAVPAVPIAAPYSDDEDDAIQQRLADLGYL